MERGLMLAALRVLSTVSDGRRATASDIDFLRSNAEPQERAFDLDELARSIVMRSVRSRRIHAHGP